LAVQLVRPILRFTSDRIIQLDGFEAVLSTILVHKTAHESMVAVRGSLDLGRPRVPAGEVSWPALLLAWSIHRAATPRTDNKGADERVGPRTTVLHVSPKGTKAAVCLNPSLRASSRLA
jgi:hypothetical protein